LEHDAGASTDYHAVSEALTGLRDAYLALPVDSALAALLSSPSRDGRNAARRASAEHEARAGAIGHLREIADSAGGPHGTTVRLAQWVARIADREHRLLDDAETALSRGDPWTADRLLALSGGGSIPGVEEILARQIAGIWESSPLRVLGSRTTHLRTSTEFARGYVVNPLWASYVLVAQPSFADEMINDERYLPWRDIYFFRVMTGLQEPIRVDDP
jgi:hypothetical protein